MKNLTVLLLLLSVSQNPFTRLAFGQNWEQVGQGMGSNVRFLESVEDTLFAVKYSNIQDTTVLLKLSDTSWQTIDDVCFTSGIQSIIEHENGLIYTMSCGIVHRAIGATSLIGHDFGAMGFGHYQGDLIAVGWFDTVNGLPASRVARWDGMNWSAIDTTIWNNAIGCAIEYQGELYVGGNMWNEHWDIDRIGRWDGTQWKKVGNGIHGGMGSVNCFEIYHDDLYMGGSFTDQNGNPGPKIARWNGEQWLDVGGGINSPGVNGCSVQDMVVFNDELYAVGSCAYAGGISAQYIAKWNGTEWCGFGDVFNNTISSIEVHQGELYIGGGFTTINDDTIYRVAKWVGGDFVDQCGTLSSIEDTEAEPAQLTISPNPTTSTTTITWKGQTHGNYQLQLFDAQGRQIVPPVSSTKNGEWELDMRGLAPGIYFGQLVAAEERPFGSAQGKSFKVVRE